MILAQICYVITQTIQISEFRSKVAKMTLKVKVNDPHFQYPLRVSNDACFCANLAIPAQICDELWTDGRNDKTPSALKNKG